MTEVIQQAKSNKEEMEDLKKRCSSLNDTIVGAIKGKDATSLSDDLKDSIGRLVRYVPSSANDIFTSTSI